MIITPFIFIKANTNMTQNYSEDYVDLRFLDMASRTEIGEALVNVKWEWYCFMRLPHNASSADAKAFFDQWSKELFLREGCKIDYYGIFDPALPPCAYVLMMGGICRSLCFFPESIEEKQERLASITGQPVIIKPIDNTIKVVMHIVKKTFFSDSEIFEPADKSRRKSRLIQDSSNYSCNTDYYNRLKEARKLSRLIDEVWDEVDRINDQMPSTDTIEVDGEI